MNPFNNNPDDQPEKIEPGALEAISRAEIDVAMGQARKYDRKLPVVKQNMINFACMDQETAEGCFYTLPRGGKTIQGPSVRLAEIAVSCYGNLRAGTRIIATVTDDANPHVVVQAVAMDLQNNIQISIEKRRRIVKKKSRDTIDEDDINLATNACSAIAFRDAVFKVVPLALVKPAFEAAKKVAIGDAKSLSERRGKCVDTFGKMGITVERLLGKLEKTSVEEIGLEDLEMLLGLRNAIKEGEVSLDEAFPVTAKADQHKPVATGLQQAFQGQATPAATAGQDKPAEKAPQAAAKTAQDEPGQKQATPTPSKAETPQPEPAVNAPTPPDDSPEGVKALAAAGLAPAQEPTKAPETQAPVQTEQAPASNVARMPYEFKPSKSESDALQSVRLLMAQAGVTEPEILAWTGSKNLSKQGQKLADLAESKLINIAAKWQAILPHIVAGPEPKK